MANKGDFLRSELIGRVSRLAGERIERDRLAKAQAMIRGLYANVAFEDIGTTDPESLYAAAMALLSFARRRSPGLPKLRIYNPRLDESGWTSGHTVVEVVNDDMPFLVDSLTAALNRQGLTVHLVIHPILAVERDAEGHLISLNEATGNEAHRESFMHIEIDQRNDPAGNENLAQYLLGVLTDVRAAVADWRPMRDRVAELVGSGLDGPDAQEVTEARDFLNWLAEDHFTFLGWRSFHFAEDGSIGTVTGSGLGILRDPATRMFDEARALAVMPPEVRDFVRRPNLLLITKSNRTATVHRPVPMDIIGLKRFDGGGRVVGLEAILGLFAATAYTLSPSLIPVLRRKVERVIARTGFLPDSHDGKALLHIIESYPRDEVFQMSEDALFEAVLGILHLQERQRVALFLRHDEFDRFISCLVYVPRDRYDTRLRHAFRAILEQSFNGHLATFSTEVGNAPLARIHFIIHIDPDAIPDYRRQDIEARLAEAARSWMDRVQETLTAVHGEEHGLHLVRRYAEAFPASYGETTGIRAAAFDIERIEAVLAGSGLEMNLYRLAEATESEARFKIYRAGRPLALSAVLPLLEHLGFKVISEVPHQVRPAGLDSVWIHDFALDAENGGAFDLGKLRERFHEAFLAVWQGEAEDDGFNVLVLRAGLTWRQGAVLRAYAKFLRQAGFTFSQAYLEKALTDNAPVAALLVRLFEARFDPADGESAEAETLGAIDQALDGVVSADDDRILRRFLNLIRATLRTNYFQRGADGAPKPCLALKLNSGAIDDLPLPRPWVEIFIYSPRVEAVHLRGGKVARGGIRWSDRREDFRTEILGLMKAQMVKNAVIIPVGAKGGFVVKRPPAGREALQAEGIACYQTMMRGLLDLTDTLSGGQVVPPPALRRHDDDDPYLVVAADKGTASFSDIANTISLTAGFWLGDAFASGGSHGYDHKAMGITARGAWESVKRHFREIGRDVQSTDFTVMGVGDMSGDVFGNGMLRSPHIRLVAAFNHQHIFLDPDPDPARSFAERRRLFENPRSQWSDYDPVALSPGGGVFDRNRKNVPLSPEARALLGIEAAQLPPHEIIKALLKAPVDLLWFGGIGTYVKATHESHAEVGDRANDAVRVSASELRCKVVAEGANLAVTQLGRIEYALSGGRLNTDAIDNSAGVDTSDHEVNIKILLNEAVSDGDLTLKQRNEMLTAMTDEVGGLVLRDNYLQTQAIATIHSHAAALLDQHDRLLRLLEKSGRLNRAMEFLPDDEALAERATAKQGLTRPELAVLMAYSKIWLFDCLLQSDLPEDPLLGEDLMRYFPAEIRRRYPDRIAGHRLRREIIATVATNSMINRVGGTFLSGLMERTGMPVPDIARAYLVVRDAFHLRDLWRRIEALDNRVQTTAQVAMFTEVNRLVERGTLWMLRHGARPLDMGAARAELEPGIEALHQALAGDLLPPELASAIATRAQDFIQQDVPEDLARRVAAFIVLASACDIIRLAGRCGAALHHAAQVYFAIGSRFALGWLRAAAESLGRGTNHWQKLAASAVIEELYGHQREVTRRVLELHPDLPPDQAIAEWSRIRRPVVERADQLLGELRMAGRADLAILTVANRQLRALTEG